MAKSQLQIEPLPSDTSAADIVRSHFADSNLVILSAARLFLTGPCEPVVINKEKLKVRLKVGRFF